MKKTILVAALVALSGSMMMASVANASPNLIKYHFICPKTTGHDANTLLNDGKKVQGYGSQFIMDKRTQENPFFSSLVGGSNIPSNIKNGDYTSSSTSYNSTDGKVRCHYKSSNGYDSFHVEYTMSNGKGGAVKESSPTQITIQKFVG